MSHADDSARPWYAGLGHYHWLVLIIASLGWVFDIFEGQIFVASMNEAMPSLVAADTAASVIDYFNKRALAFYLAGGAVGGVLFGMLSDRIGRTKTMILTILMYSLFTCVTAFAQNVWQMTILRFLVALGTGGEWAVASAMVAEVFPKRARAWSLGIFHASSVFGTYLAVLAGLLIPLIGWRYGFVLGAVPALLTLWIRWSLKEPEQWKKVHEAAQEGRAQKAGRLSDLFVPQLIRNTIVGITLATIGLATFWGVHIYGKDLLRQAAERPYVADLPQDASAAAVRARLDALDAGAKHSIKNWEMLGMFLVTTGGGLGLVSFGPICERIGRRGAFLFFHLAGLAIAIVCFQVLDTASTGVLIGVLPVFGYLTLGMHAGYAIYFPELFPTRLRGTGGGFCFNGGRLLAAPVIWINGWMRATLALSLEDTVTILSLLFLLGLIVLLFAPETKGRELPE
jgi:MFS family permease